MISLFSRIRRSIRLIRKKVLPRAFVPSPEPDIESFTSSASPSTSSCISSVTSSEALKLPAPHEETKTSDDGRTVITLPIRGANESLTSKSATTVGDQELNDEKAEGSEVSTRASSVNRDGEMSSSDSSVRSSVHGAASTIARRGSSDEGKESPSNKSTTTIGVEDLSEAEAEEYEEATSVNRDGEMSSPGSSVQTGVHITASTVALRGSSDEGEVSSAESSVSKSEPRKLPLVAPEAKRGPATTRRPSTANGTEASSPASSLESHVVVTHAEIHRSTTQPSRSSETSLDSEEGADKIEEAPIMSETTNASPPRKKCRPSTPKPRPRTPDTPQTSPSTRKSTSIKSDDRSESSLDSDIEANASPPSKKRIPPTLKPRPRTPDTPQTSPSTRKSTSIKSDARSETSLDSDIETDTINEAASVRERTNASPPNKKQRPRTPDTPQTSPSTRKSTSIKSDNSSETSLDSEVEADAINEATTVRERRNASPPKKKLRPSTPKPRPRTPDTPQTSPSTRKSTSIKSDDRSDTSLDSEIESDAVAEVATVREGTYAIPQQTRFRPPTPKPRPRTPDTPQTSPSVKKSTSIKSDGRSTPSLCSEIEAITTMADRTNKRPPKNRPRPPTPKPRPRARRTSSESISSPPKLKNNSG